MTARLGNALYMLGCLLAFGIIAAEAAAVQWLIVPDGQQFSRWMLTAFTALIFWLIGRACRYVLAGR